MSQVTSLTLGLFSHGCTTVLKNWHAAKVFGGKLIGGIENEKNKIWHNQTFRGLALLIWQALAHRWSLSPTQFAPCAAHLCTTKEAADTTQLVDAFHRDPFYISLMFLSNLLLHTELVHIQKAEAVPYNRHSMLCPHYQLYHVEC